MTEAEEKIEAMLADLIENGIVDHERLVKKLRSNTGAWEVVDTVMYDPGGGIGLIEVDVSICPVLFHDVPIGYLIGTESGDSGHEIEKTLYTMDEDEAREKAQEFADALDETPDQV